MDSLTFIERYASKPAYKPENKSQWAKKLTHLYINDKFIRKIGNITPCENLQVLYLHNNEITKISNLSSLRTLKHLYLQYNRITKIEGLGNLRQLRKLYLGHNEISVVEGLEDLKSLEELHIEKQRLNKGESLCFDPRSITKIADHLQVLNVSHNNLSNINDLAPLKQMKTLTASYNKLSEIKNVVQVVRHWYYLLELNLTGNSIARQHRYRETLIANTFRLVVLDNKDINESTRCFIKKFEHEKTQKRPPVGRAPSAPDIPGDVAPPLRRVVSRSIAKNLKSNLSSSLLTTSLSEEEVGYIPWQALRTSEGDAKYVPPLFARQKPKKSRPAKRVQFSTVFPQFPG